MADSWVRLYASLRDHPKISKLARRLGVDVATARGYVTGLWSWSADYARDGLLIPKHEPSDFEPSIGWKGDEGAFVAAAIRVGLLDKHPRGVVTIHDWLDGPSSWKQAIAKAQSRAKAMNKKSDGKDKTLSEMGKTIEAAHLGLSVHSMSVTEGEREESKGEKSKGKGEETEGAQGALSGVLDPRTASTSKAPSASPVAITFPCRATASGGGRKAHVTEEDLRRWQEDYPAVNIPALAKHVRNYLEEQPSRQRGAAKVRAWFINVWCLAEQSKGKQSKFHWSRFETKDAQERAREISGSPGHDESDSRSMIRRSLDGQ